MRPGLYAAAVQPVPPAMVDLKVKAMVLVLGVLCAACAGPRCLDPDPLLQARWRAAWRACAVAMLRACGADNPCAFDFKPRCLALQGYERVEGGWRTTLDGRRELDLAREAAR